MAENSRQSKLSEKDDECVFTWKLFTGWDYMIGNSETAHNRTASIILGFKEALLEEAEKKRDERRYASSTFHSVGSWKMLALRIFTNINVLWLFASSVYAVVLVVERSTKQRQTGGWWQQNEVTIVVSLITNVFPFIFEMLGSLEQYHPRKRLRMQLARIMVLNMLNLYTFILASFSKISDMSIQLQDIKKNLTNMSIQPSELLLGKKIPTTPSSPVMVTEILYNEIFTGSQSSTVSPCYIEKVNCTTKMTEPAKSTSVSPPTGPSMSTAQSPSSVSTLTTFLLLGSMLNNNSIRVEPSAKNVSSYESYSNDTDDRFNTNVFMKDQMLQDTYDYNEYDYDSANKNSTKDVLPRHIVKPSNEIPQEQNSVETKHYIIPVHVELFNYDKYNNESSDDDYLTPEDYPDMNNTNVDTGSEDDVSNYTSTTTDDGCRYITVCPDTSTYSSTQSTSPMTSSAAYFPEFTEAKVQTVLPTTTTNGEFVPPHDLSLYTKSLDTETRRKLRRLCWETMFGQELVKLTVMDLVLTILSTLVVDFFRAIFVRTMNNCWCWDLEKKFPQYGDFKIAENILHLVNNQGMVWMGMFFSPGLPIINLIKLIVMMYLRSWTVLTCNVPHEVVFRASSSNNFYLALLLTMLFLCVLPVSYAIVWVEPSWHCGPFSNYEKIYHLFTNSTKKALPNKTIHKALDYIASPGIVIPLLMLLVLIIYYLISLTNALREANNDLKVQLRRERTEERRKVFQMVDHKHRVGGPGDLIESTPFQKWQKTMNVLPNGKTDQISNDIKEENGQNSDGVLKTDAKKFLSKLTKHTTHRHTNEENIPIVDADGTDVEQVESLPDDRIVIHHGHSKSQHHTIPIDVHDDNTGIHHKHKHGTHVRHEKHIKNHGSLEKEAKKENKKQIRKDSSTSVCSDNIPEIRISQSTDDELQEETRNEQPSKSSSVDTIIVAGEEAAEHQGSTTHNKKMQKEPQKVVKHIEKVDNPDDNKVRQKKHHKKSQKDDVQEKRHSETTKHEIINDNEDDSMYVKKHEKEKHLIEKNTGRIKHKDYNIKLESDKVTNSVRTRTDHLDSEGHKEKEHKSGREVDKEGDEIKKLKHHTHVTHEKPSRAIGKAEISDESEGSEEEKKILTKKKKQTESGEKDSGLHFTPESPLNKEFSFKLKPKHKFHSDSSSQALSKRSSEASKIGELEKSDKHSKSERNKLIEEEEEVKVEPHKSSKHTSKSKDRITKEKHTQKNVHETENKIPHRIDVNVKGTKISSKIKSDGEKTSKRCLQEPKEEMVQKEKFTRDDEPKLKHFDSCENVKRLHTVDVKTENLNTHGKSKKIQMTVSESQSGSESDDGSYNSKKGRQKKHNDQLISQRGKSSNSTISDDSCSKQEPHRGQHASKSKANTLSTEESELKDTSSDDDEDSHSQQSQLLARKGPLEEDASNYSSNESINERST